jgi:S-DNA-T family DNA segregation ATPase FtsK/SpoIIIE
LFGGKPADDKPQDASKPAAESGSQAPAAQAAGSSPLGALRGRMFGKPKEDTQETPKPDDDKPAGENGGSSPFGGLRGRMFGKPEDKPQGAAKPVTPDASKSKPAAANLNKPAATPMSGSRPAPGASPFAPSKPAPQSGDGDDEPEEAVARLGDLIKTPAPATNPFRRPEGGTPVAPRSPLSPAKSPLPPDEDDEDDEKPAAAPFAKPASPFGKPLVGKPFQPPKPLSPEDEMDALDEDEEEDETAPSGGTSPAASRSPFGAPVRPAGGSPFRFGAGSKPEEDDELDLLDDEDEDEETHSPLTERQDRLNAIRSGQTFPKVDVANSDTAKPDGRKDEMPKSTPDAARAPAVQHAPPEKPTPAPQTSSEPAPKPETPVMPTVAAKLRPFAPPDQPVKRSPDFAIKRGEENKDAQKPAQPLRPQPFTPPTTAAGTPPAATKPSAPASKFSTSGMIPGVSEPTSAPNITLPGAPSAERSSAWESLRDSTTPPGVRPPSSAPPAAAPRKKRDWRLPDYRTLLASGSEEDFDREFLVERARIIEETLLSFGAPGKVVEINTGPVITQFGVEPAYLLSRSGKKNRVKVSAIAQLDKDLQLALGAKSIRVEAPVPGKGYVGIEVPNEQAALVSLRDVMDSEEFKKIDSPLTIALGQSVDGTPVAADLSVMPHLLIAGTTGSGKSVCVNSIITSLLLRNTPDKLKFVMVDPKRVELTGYNGIPHLIAPVVVELERIVGVLKWVTREMDERYKRFSNAGARNIEDFNKHIPANEVWMPYIIVIIDELADLMMLAPDETERVITRIAALARATGIHLVIATQRPSVDVVTGLIKANFPARIAFAVASSVDSRVILDQPGAERLLGRGDMLYQSGDSPAPVRLQGVFVSDMEINNISRYWRSLDSDEAPQTPTMVLDKSAPATAPAASSSPARPAAGERSSLTPARTTQQTAFWDDDKSDNRDANNDGEDDLYEEAVELVRRLNKASVSLLQRRLRIGYTRAARLIDLMEERGVVGPAESGSKPREVLPVR